MKCETEFEVGGTHNSWKTQHKEIALKQMFAFMLK